MNRHLLRVDDLADEDIARIRARTTHLLAGATHDRGDPATLGLAFLEPSLRTRVGFAAAAGRLGWPTVDVFDVRTAPTAESWADTLRTLSGYCDMVVCRPGRAMSEGELGDLPALVISGGDVGEAAEHPTQSLIDLCAFDTLAGPTDELTIAVVGDLRMRSARSLLAMLSRVRPQRLVLVTAGPFADGVDAPAGVPTERRTLAELDDVDALYVVGMPHESISEDLRATLRVTEAVLAGMRPEAVVLSPMPVLDEIEASARGDARVRVFEQSDLGLPVRTAVLEMMRERAIRRS